MANHRVLVTGSTGNLGEALLSQLSAVSDIDIIPVNRQQLDLSWPEINIFQALDALRPNILINTAGFTQVDDAETQQELAFKVNAEGPKNLAIWALTHHAYLIHVSTDYVFDGKKGTPYDVIDRPRPINCYGASKAEGENAILSVLPEAALVLRTSWLFGKAQRNFVPFVVQAAQSQTPIRVASDQIGTPTWTGSLCKIILKALSQREIGIRHGCNHGLVSRYEQARFLCEKMGIASDFITPVSTQALGLSAKRPKNSALKTSYPDVLDWQEATNAYLATQGLLKNDA